MLSRISISAKIFLIIGLMSVAAITISAIGATGLNALARSADAINEAGNMVRLSARLNQNLIDLNRNEYAVAADPSELDEAQEAIAGIRAEALDRLGRLKASAGEEALPAVLSAEERLNSYLQTMDRTFALAQAARGVELPDAQRRVLAQVEQNRGYIRQARQEIAALADFLSLAADEAAADAEAIAAVRSTLLIAVAFIGVLAGAGIGFAVARFGIAAPLSVVMGGIKSLADGDLKTEIRGGDRGDEIGALAGLAVYFQGQLKRTNELEEEAEKTEARARAQRAEDMARLADEFEAAVGEIVAEVGSAAEQLLGNANSMAAIAEETNRQAATVSAAAEQASANVQSVAGATEEFSATISEVVQQIAQSSRQAREASEQASDSAAAMDQLRAVVDTVASVTELISKIAEQTNLLALNATIEAARAGDAGKGFAVVASEVKALAEQTAKATDEITSKIGEMQSATGRSAKSVETILGQIKAITEGSDSVAAAAEEQQATTQEIARNVAEAATGTNEVTASMSGIAEASEAAGKSSSEVKDAASMLTDQTRRLRDEMTAFVQKVRAA